jgi:hypothetical protein
VVCATFEPQKPTFLHAESIELTALVRELLEPLVAADSIASAARRTLRTSDTFALSFTSLSFWRSSLSVRTPAVASLATFRKCLHASFAPASSSLVAEVTTVAGRPDVPPDVLPLVLPNSELTAHPPMMMMAMNTRHPIPAGAFVREPVLDRPTRYCSILHRPLPLPCSV